MLFPDAGGFEWFALVVSLDAFLGMTRIKWDMIPVIVGCAAAGFVWKPIIEGLSYRFSSSCCSVAVALHSSKRKEIIMRWITREHVKVDRVACPWLIKKFVDREAEFFFVAAEKVQSEALRLGAIPYDVPGAELGHHGKECSFDAIVKKYRLTGDPALVLLARIVNGADTDNSLHHQAEGPGLNAIAEGFRHLGFGDDHAINAAEWIVYDALYAYCREMVGKGKHHGAYSS